MNIYLFAHSCLYYVWPSWKIKYIVILNSEYWPQYSIVWGNINLKKKVWLESNEKEQRVLIHSSFGTPLHIIYFFVLRLQTFCFCSACEQLLKKRKRKEIACWDFWECWLWRDVFHYYTTLRERRATPARWK